MFILEAGSSNQRPRALWVESSDDLAFLPLEPTATAMLWLGFLLRLLEPAIIFIGRFDTDVDSEATCFITATVKVLLRVRILRLLIVVEWVGKVFHWRSSGKGAVLLDRAVRNSLASFLQALNWLSTRIRDEVSFAPLVYAESGKHRECLSCVFYIGEVELETPIGTQFQVLDTTVLPLGACSNIKSELGF